MLTDRQIATRRQYVGASEVPAICGVSPFRSAWDVWAEKVVLVDPQPPNEAMMLGLILEPALLDWAHREIAPLRRNVQRVVRLSKSCRLRATLDGVFQVDGHIEPVEVKIGTAYSPRSQEWGEPQTDEVPLDVRYQVQAQLMACQAPIGHVLALLPGPRLAHFCLHADRDLQEQIKEQVLAFWDCVKKREPPSDSAPTPATFNAMNREDRFAEVDFTLLDTLLSEYMVAREQRLAAEKAEQRAKNRLFELAGSASGLKASTAERRLCVRFVKRTQMRFDMDRVRQLLGEEQLRDCRREVSWYEIKVEN